MFFRIEYIQCTLYNVLKCTARYKLVYSRENSVHAGMYNIYSGGHGLYHDNYRVGQVKKSCKKDRNRTGTGQEQDRKMKNKLYAGDSTLRAGGKCRN